VLYWITNVLAVYGDLPTALAALLNAGLILYLSVFVGLFAVAVRRLLVKFGPMSLLASPFLWITFELARGYVTGFPWEVLGNSQLKILPVAQLASVGGVNSLSFLTAAVSAAIVIATMPHAPAPRVRYVPAVVVLLAIVVIAAWGSRRLADNALTRQGDIVRVGMVQGNVDQAIKWDPASAAKIFRDYIKQTRQAIFEGATLVMWPESSTPFMFEEDPSGAEVLKNIARQAHVSILFGSDQIERGRPTRYYNSTFLIRPDGTTGGVYRKMRLVPFGEYVPMHQLLFFAAPLTEKVGTFTPGDRVELLPVDGHRLSVAICYEVVYPGLVRQEVTAGSELLTTVTNDAWFGDTSAPLQHFEQAAMRSIENGRYLVRAANTGISGIVDPYGRVLQQSKVFEPAVLVGEVRFLNASTFYTRHGDIVGIASIVFTVLLLVWPTRRVQ
jgi:apolipoprotein N-acyltransferase